MTTHHKSKAVQLGSFVVSYSNARKDAVKVTYLAHNSTGNAPHELVRKPLLAMFHELRLVLKEMGESV